MLQCRREWQGRRSSSLAARTCETHQRHAGKWARAPHARSLAPTHSGKEEGSHNEPDGLIMEPRKRVRKGCKEGRRAERHFCAACASSALPTPVSCKLATQYSSLQATFMQAASRSRQPANGCCPPSHHMTLTQRFRGDGDRHAQQCPGARRQRHQHQSCGRHVGNSSTAR